MALALAISHDMQAHVDRREMFSCEDIPKKYESETARKYKKNVWKHLKKTRPDDSNSHRKHFSICIGWSF